MTMETFCFGNPDAQKVLIQPVDEHDLEVLENEFSIIKSLTDTDFYLIAAKVGNWNKDLSPWKAPAVFGSEDFGDGAGDFLKALLPLCSDSEKSYYIGGYSLAGLFALWAHYECDAFDAVVAASPSVWYSGWDAYADAHAPRGAAYLSLGKQEPRTRNRQMATVGDAIRRQADRFRDIPATLAWNEGNHFAEPEVRVARGFEWALRTIAGNGIKRIQSTEK